ncbi:hypothetical protein [Clostridium oryzae]|uniref:Peptidase C39-like domain-containing protein n=1 Tax=Clostridium oryzae TaxID=1450648 RepID=A0A1V4IWI9_9CLOT|nr:hypothetical protein [Clostridium oryzae]OPJ64155.1 hypothetical protein CLORY_07030 [Clostridium oryzae]
MPLDHKHIDEIKIPIYEFNKEYYGGNQYWFPKKLHQLSGCGPIAAANIMAYLAENFSENYRALYPYSLPISKGDFVNHIVEVRKFVKPGIRGLTSVHQFCENTLDYAKSRNVLLTPHILEDDTVSMEEVVHYLSEALLQKLPVAILVLTHAVKELEDYSWHWMTITDLKFNAEDNNTYIVVSTYGERHVIDLNILWNHRCTKDRIKFAYFS